MGRKTTVCAVSVLVALAPMTAFSKGAQYSCADGLRMTDDVSPPDRPSGTVFATPARTTRGSTIHPPLTPTVIPGDMEFRTHEGPEFKVREAVTWRAHPVAGRVVRPVPDNCGSAAA